MDKKLLLSSIEKNVSFVFSHSGGKGGQNVNKVSTRVQAFIALERLEGLSLQEKQMLLNKLSNLINANDEIFIAVDNERSQNLNKELAIKRLSNKIVKACYIPKKRKATKPTKASYEKRLKTKKIRAFIKANRKTFE